MIDAGQWVGLLITVFACSVALALFASFLRAR